MARIAVGVEYDGRRYAGWQTQQHLPTVQQVVEAALGRVAAAPVALVCAGRTDAGVHAYGQVAHFDTGAQRTTRAWLLGANSELPPDVALSWVQPVPDDFHARFSAQARTYRYLILNRGARAALTAGRALWVHRPLAADLMAEAAQALVGEHDFSALRAAECQAKSPVRRVERLHVRRDGDWITIEVTANAFLHHMVRNIAGLLLAIGRGDAPVAWAAQVLLGRERARSAATAAAAGLYLHAVRYPAQFGLPGAATLPWPPFEA
ncbi:MAG: tRNA pseudouridine(38-40) synthase TruA [Proteobacteria bacterium]|nr:tRNA pseudouridine(38-40) synthase TruA [Pseudomonadota bacterium]